MLVAYHTIRHFESKFYNTPYSKHELGRQQRANLRKRTFWRKLPLIAIAWRA